MQTDEQTNKQTNSQNLNLKSIDQDLEQNKIRKKLIVQSLSIDKKNNNQLMKLLNEYSKKKSNKFYLSNKKFTRKHHNHFQCRIWMMMMMIDRHLPIIKSCFWFFFQFFICKKTNHRYLLWNGINVRMIYVK